MESKKLPVVVRNARPADLVALTLIAQQAKASWGYPQAWLDEWADALTFVPSDLQRQAVFVAQSAR